MQIALLCASKGTDSRVGSTVQIGGSARVLVPLALTQRYAFGSCCGVPQLGLEA